MTVPRSTSMVFLHDGGESLQFGSQHNDLHGLLDPLSITAAETARQERHNLPTNSQQHI